LSASIKHSNETNEQYTPAEVVEASRQVLGVIDLDPATSELANKRVRATNIYTVEDGAKTFEDVWEGNVFLNPPGGKRMVIKGTGFNSNPALFWAKLMHDWNGGHVHAAIVLGFTIEVLQTTQSLEEFPMLRFPFCVPSKRLAFDVPRAEKLRQLRERRDKAKAAGGSSKRLEALRGQIRALKASEDEIVSGDDPPHANVLVFVPPRAEHHFGEDETERPWVAWGGPYTRRFFDVFSGLGYVRL